MMPWKAAGGGPRSPISPFPAAPVAAGPSQEEEQQRDQAAALAVSDRRTLYLVNIFIGSAARFLNSFAAICEDKLADVHRRILRLDSTLRLLEAKLSGTSICDGEEPEQKQHHPSSSTSSSPPPPPSHPSDQVGTSSTDAQVGY